MNDEPGVVIDSNMVYKLHVVQKLLDRLSRETKMLKIVLSESDF